MNVVGPRYPMLRTRLIPEADPFDACIFPISLANPSVPRAPHGNGSTPRTPHPSLAQPTPRAPHRPPSVPRRPLPESRRAVLLGIQGWRPAISPARPCACVDECRRREHLLRIRRHQEGQSPLLADNGDSRACRATCSRVWILVHYR